MNSQPTWQGRRHFYTALLLIFIFFAGFAAGNFSSISRAQTYDGDILPPADADQVFAPFWEVYNLIQKNYIDVPDQEIIVNGAIKGMVDALEDQYSGYIEPELFEYIDDRLSGSIEGIGAVISEIEETGEIEIVNVLPETPADRAGLQEGDVFIQVDGEEISGLSYLEVAARVRGPSGSTVNLIMRRGEEMLEFDIERARIDIPNTETKVLEDSIGYIKLNQFTAEARRDMDQALADIELDELDGLIVDVRGNPGGYLSSVLDVTSLFLEDGVIVYEAFGDGTEQTFTADGSYVELDIPLVILIDERSASASEILAGSLKDNGVATIIGVTSFGKGTVQTQSELVNGGGLRLTIARWLTPNREWIHGQGVTPDIVVEWTVEDREANPDDDPQLNAALEFLRSPEAETSR